MTGVDYEIRVVGVIPDAVLLEIEGVRAVTEPAHTVLRGPVPDDAALHGIIQRLQGLGLELLEVRRVPEFPAFVPPRRDPQETPP